jgi:peptide/nickel transport system substrate-binding protein
MDYLLVLYTTFNIIYNKLRRLLMYKIQKISTLVSIAILSSTFSGVAMSNTMGGVVNVAIIGEADTLDPMMSSKDVVGTVTQHIYETLFTFDSSWAPAPLLADGMPDVSSDGLTYTIKIRQGVNFHDGSSMDSADVVDSLNRWLSVASRGKSIASKVDSVSALDSHTVEIKLNSVYSALLSLMSMNNAAAVIYPQENIQGDDLAAPIGTGPYKVGEYKADQYLQLVRYDGYSSSDAPIDGAAGSRAAYLDEINFIPVGDGSTRLEGLLSGQFDFAESIAAESYARLESSSKAEPVLLAPYGWPMWVINHKKGIMTNLNVRKALQAALPAEEMLYAAFGDEKFYKADGALYPEGFIWNSDAGLENYGTGDIKKASAFLKASNYDGSPLRILTSKQYMWHFKTAEVAKVYLEQAGFKVQMDVVDWATLGQRRNNPDLWDVFLSHSPYIPEPSLNGTMQATYRSGWTNGEKEYLMSKFTSVTDTAERVAIWSQIQDNYFEDVGFIKLGSFNSLRGKSQSLKGVPETPWPFFWNAYK